MNIFDDWYRERMRNESAEMILSPSFTIKDLQSCWNAAIASTKRKGDNSCYICGETKNQYILIIQHGEVRKICQSCNKKEPMDWT